MKKRYYPLQELLDRANQQLNQYPDLDQSRFTKRTVYYYVQEGLLERPQGIRRGPRAPYPAEFVDLLLFIRRLQSEEALTLEHIRSKLLETSAQTIQQVAAGEKSLEAISVDKVLAASLTRDKQKANSIKHTSQSKAKKLSRAIVSDPLASESAERLESNELSESAKLSKSNELSESAELSIEESASAAVQAAVEIYQAGGQAKLEVEGKISAHQHRQLIQATNLIQTILEDTEEDSKD